MTAISITPHQGQRHWLLGHMPAFNDNTLSFLRGLTQEGAFVQTRFGPFDFFIVNTPELAHEVLVTKAAHMRKSRVLRLASSDTIGTGLFTADGELWKRQRKLAQPAFHSKRISAYADVMVQYAQEAAQAWHNGAALDMETEMTRLTMRIITKTMFDTDVDAEAQALSEAMTIGLSMIDKRTRRLVAWPRWWPNAENKRMQAALKRLHDTVQHFVDARRNDSSDKGDLLSMLLAARDENGQGMDEAQLRWELVTVFGAGHETTANALTWAWYLLSQHPDKEAALHAELKAVLDGRSPSVDDLAKLPYTEWVLKEAMRLYPPAWAVTREVVEDTELGGHAVRARTPLMVNIYGMHHDARYFPNPEQFMPERWADDSAVPKYAYLPFGAGPRVCIGNGFAMMEGRLVLAALAQRYRFRLAPGHRVEPERVFTLRPKYGMAMLAETR